MRIAARWAVAKAVARPRRVATSRAGETTSPPDPPVPTLQQPSSPSSPPSPGVAAGGARSAYTTLATPAFHTHEAKKSKFVATAWPVTSHDDAARLIATAADPAASHNCWALAVGAAVRCSDDGEPAGTAGRPILAAITSAGLDGVALLVTRHHGGTKLGTGGLVRAYGGAARDCLAGAARVDIQPATVVFITAPLGDVGSVYECLSAAGGARAGEEAYEGGGSVVTLVVSMPRPAVAAFVSALAARTAGRAACVVEEE